MQDERDLSQQYRRHLAAELKADALQWQYSGTLWWRWPAARMRGFAELTHIGSFEPEPYIAMAGFHVVTVDLIADLSRQCLQCRRLTLGGVG